MFFCSINWADNWWAEPERAAASLGLFAGHQADSCRIGGNFFAQLADMRGPARRGWRVARSPSGWPVLLCGVIDNLSGLASELGRQGTPEQLYGAAVERWGSLADRHIVGEYGSLTILPDGTVRLARSAWSGKPVFYHRDDDGLLVSSLSRPLFAAGLPRRLKAGTLECLVAGEQPPGGPILYQDIDQVLGGTVVLINRGKSEVVEFYDPDALAPVRLKRDEDYVEAAAAMLGEAAAAMLRLAKRPAVTLSGGLDSSLVCDEMWRQLGPQSNLKAYTFVQLPEWDGRSAPHMYGSDRPYVEQFLELHPGLNHRFIDNRDVDPFTLLDERMVAGEGYASGSAISFPHLGVCLAAKEDGCDWIFSGWLGNMTLSSETPWAMAEFFRTLRWGEGWKLAASNNDDARPMWRRFLAGGLMPNLPAGLAQWVRENLRPGQQRAIVANPYLPADGPLADKRKDFGLNRGDLDYLQSRENFVRSLYRSYQTGGEMALGVQQVTGLAGRDLYAYRPLLELFLAMPTDQFVRGGSRRHLARRVAQGRLPEAQRTEIRHGDHVADWHARMTKGLPRLRAELAALAGHPELSALIDLAAIQADLDNWPEVAPTDIDTINRLRFHLPTMFVLRRYIDYVSGRNAA